MKSKMRPVFFETIQIVTITSSKTSMQLNEANSPKILKIFTFCFRFETKILNITFLTLFHVGRGGNPNHKPALRPSKLHQFFFTFLISKFHNPHSMILPPPPTGNVYFHPHQKFGYDQSLSLSAKYLAK